MSGVIGTLQGCRWLDPSDWIIRVTVIDLAGHAPRGSRPRPTSLTVRETFWPGFFVPRIECVLPHKGETVKTRLMAAALTAAVLGGLVACQPTESDCEWELESVAYVAKPHPGRGGSRGSGGGGSRPNFSKPKTGPGAAVKPPRPAAKPPKGKAWSYDCD